MPRISVDLDKEQAKKDFFFRRNKYSLDDRFVINDGKKHPLAVLVPGGGYDSVCSCIEGTPIARKLNELDISCFIVIYRVKKKAKFPNPLDDLAKGIKEILDNKDKYNLDINNYSVWGSSAGGHLTAMFGLKDIGYLKYNLPKPNTLVLSYPVISMDKTKTHMGSHDNLLGKDASKDLEDLTSVDKHVDYDYPKTFIWCGDNDTTVDPSNTYDMVKALKKANVNVKETIYPGVPHGLGVASDTIANGWINKAVDFWLNK